MGDFYGGLISGLALGTFVCSILDHVYFSRKEDKKEYRVSGNHKLIERIGNPLIIKTTDETTQKQRARIRKNQEHGLETNLEDL